MVGFAFAATMVLGQGNQEAAKLTREGIEASKAKDWDKAITAFSSVSCNEKTYDTTWTAWLELAVDFLSRGLGGAGDLFR